MSDNITDTMWLTVKHFLLSGQASAPTEQEILAVEETV